MAVDDIMSYYADYSGGTFYCHYHNFVVVVPPGAISQGDYVEIQVTASHFAPYELPDEFYPISSFFGLVPITHLSFSIYYNESLLCKD